jgi:hypothetical protein
MAVLSFLREAGLAMPRTHDEGESFITLVRETADGLGRLVAEHIRLAKVEVAADAKDYGRRVGLLAGAGAIVVVGYLFAWLAIGLALGRLIGAPLAFLAVSLVHVAAGLIALSAVSRKLKGPRVMDQTVSEVGRTVTALRDKMNGPEADHASSH